LANGFLRDQTAKNNRSEGASGRRRGWRLALFERSYRREWKKRDPQREGRNSRISVSREEGSRSYNMPEKEKSRSDLKNHWEKVT